MCLRCQRRGYSYSADGRPFSRDPVPSKARPEDLARAARIMCFKVGETTGLGYIWRDKPGKEGEGAYGS